MSGGDADLQVWVQRQERRALVRRWLAVAVVLLAVVWVTLSFVGRRLVDVERVGAASCTDACRIRVRISNHGPVPVRETEVRLPSFGPRGRTTVALRDVVAGGRSLGRGVNPQITLRDAVFVRDVTIPPGGHDDLVLVVVGSSNPLPDSALAVLPVVSLSVLGLPGP